MTYEKQPPEVCICASDKNSWKTFAEKNLWTGSCCCFFFCFFFFPQSSCYHINIVSVSTKSSIWIAGVIFLLISTYLFIFKGKRPSSSMILWSTFHLPWQRGKRICTFVFKAPTLHEQSSPCILIKTKSSWTPAFPVQLFGYV